MLKKRKRVFGVLALLILAAGIAIPTATSIVSVNNEIRVPASHEVRRAEIPSDPTLTIASTWKSAFPDRAFRELVWRLYNGGDASIYNDDVDGIANLTQAQIDGAGGITKRTVLHVLNKLEVTSFSGLEHMVGLTQFYTSRTQVSSIDISKNVALTELIVTEVNISHIDLSQNINLNFVNLSRCNLASVDFSHNQKLTSVEVGFNKLTSLDFSYNPLLVTVSAPVNKITSVNVNNCPSLKTLSVHINELTAIDLSNNPLLTNLTAIVNKFTSVDVSNNLDLTTLMLAHNDDLHTVTGLSSLTKLTSLYLSATSLSALNLHASVKPIITRLDFSCTNIRDFDLTGFTALQLLSISTAKNFVSNPSFLELTISGTRDVHNRQLTLIRPGTNALS